MLEADVINVIINVSGLCDAVTCSVCGDATRLILVLSSPPRGWSMCDSRPGTWPLLTTSCARSVEWPDVPASLWPDSDVRPRTAVALMLRRHPAPRLQRLTNTLETQSKRQDCYLLTPMLLALVWFHSFSQSINQWIKKFLRWPK